MKLTNQHFSAFVVSLTCTLYSLFSNAQDTTTLFANIRIGGNYSLYPIGGGSFSKGEVKSKYDTTILFKGIDTIKHEHQFVSEVKPMPMYGCLVLHDEAGCPDGWLNENEICIICLKHIHVSERRWVERHEIKDPYTEALEKLKKINKQ